MSLLCAWWLFASASSFEIVQHGPCWISLIFAMTDKTSGPWRLCFWLLYIQIYWSGLNANQSKKWPTSSHFKILNLLLTTVLWNLLSWLFIHDSQIYISAPSQSLEICDHAPFESFCSVHRRSWTWIQQTQKHTQRKVDYSLELWKHIYIKEKYLVLSAQKEDPHIQSHKTGTSYITKVSSFTHP